jgi:hypothetical protein
MPPPCSDPHEKRTVRPMNSSSLQHATAAAINRDRARVSRKRRIF